MVDLLFGLIVFILGFLFGSAWVRKSDWEDIKKGIVVFGGEIYTTKRVYAEDDLNKNIE